MCARTNAVRAGKRGNICVRNNVSSFARAFTESFQVVIWEPFAELLGSRSRYRLAGVVRSSIVEQLACKKKKI